MDNNNCLSLSNDLDSLELDMQDWMRMSYDMRKRANDVCILKYGCTNYQLYNALKAKLLSSEDLNADDMVSYMEESAPITEGFIKSDDALEYNVDKFMRKTVKVLFIAGLPGSGKSTIAKEYQRETNALLVELDILDSIYKFTDDDFNKMNYILKGFYNTSVGKKYRLLNTQNALKRGANIKDFVNLYRNFIEYAVQNLKADDQLILEGVHIQLVCSLGELDVNLIKNNAALLLGTSVLTSTSRAFQRDIKKYKKQKGKVDPEVILQAFSGLFTLFYTIENNEKRLQITKKIILDEVIEEAYFRFDDDFDIQPTAKYNGSGDGLTKDGRINDRLEKIQASRDAQSIDNVVIISDFIDDDNPNYTPGELEQQYTNYMGLTSDRKVRSDGLSGQIWGRSVTDMYLYMKEKFQQLYADKEMVDEDPSDTLQIDYTDQELRNYKDTITMESGDYLQSMVRKIDCLLPGNRSLREAVVLEGFGKKINGAKHSYRQDLQEVLPFITYDEYVNNPECLDQKKIHGQVDPFTYVMNWRDMKEAVSILRTAYRRGDTKTMLEMGWNPYVEPTPENFKYARERQIKWFDENYGIDIYDISNYNSSISPEMVDEASVDTRLEPIYILANSEKQSVKLPEFLPIDELSRTKFYNIGFSSDSSMRKVYSFNDTTYPTGLTTSGLESYCNMSDRRGRSDNVVITAIFVEPRLKEEIFSGIDYYMSNQGNANARHELVYQHGLGAYKGYGMYQLVARTIEFLLRVSSVYYKTMDRKVFKNRYNVFIVYNGKHTRYDIKKANILVGKLRSSYGYEKLRYVKESEVYESISSKTLEGFDIYTDNESANEVLKEVRSALRPVVIRSVSFEDHDTLEERLNMATALLGSYDSSNVEGMKKQLLELRYVINICNTRLGYLDKDHPFYSKHVLLKEQAEAFLGKFLAVVNSIDKEFDFDEYCKTSGMFKIISIGDVYSGEGNKESLFQYDGNTLKKWIPPEDELVDVRVQFVQEPLQL